MEFTQEISDMIWNEKYRFDNEPDISATFDRVIKEVYKYDLNELAKAEAHAALTNGEFIPGGRILAGGGTGRNVTLINCFVSRVIEDSSEGIWRAFTEAMLTLRQGGGIGMDFSTIRPKMAWVKGVDSDASGPISYALVWHEGCQTVMSAGRRRGAMMGVLADDHPDVLDWAVVKNKSEVLTNFNLSVLISDAFMEAVKNDADWMLGFGVPPIEKSMLVKTIEKDGKPWYVYKILKARELMNHITKSTFSYSEPGVLFIDVVNRMNNLYYCENLRACNPCGEQMLPPYGDCCLGHVNLAKLVAKPFSNEAAFDFDKLGKTASIAVRFLDNVLDVSKFPLKEQKEEAEAKRRIGVGITGLATAFQMLGVRYGSEKSIALSHRIGRILRDSVYKASIDLADEKGPFPLYDRNKYIESNFIKRLPEILKEKLYNKGIRNPVNMSIAPVGTTSILYNNITSGIEPPPYFTGKRKIKNRDGKTFREMDVVDYGYATMKKYYNDKLPDYMVKISDLTTKEHLDIISTFQYYIDSSISKTINCPTNISYEDFKNVYPDAYKLGCKCCSTYRYSPVRGAIIEEDNNKKKENLFSGVKMNDKKRPVRLSGATYKFKWPNVSSAFYVTINDRVDSSGKKRPYELFIYSASSIDEEWIKLSTRNISSIFRTCFENDVDVDFIIEDMSKITSTQGVFYKGKYYGSKPALLGEIVRCHLIGESFENGDLIEEVTPEIPHGEVCPQCNNSTIFKIEDCKKCECGYSTCA